MRLWSRWPQEQPVCAAGAVVEAVRQAAAVAAAVAAADGAVSQAEPGAVWQVEVAAAEVAGFRSEVARQDRAAASALG